MLFFLGYVLPYAAVAVFVIGLTLRTGNWLRKPVPYPLALVPARRGWVSQAAAVARELLLFRALYRGDRRLWWWAWLMHATLAGIVVGHVVGIAFAGRQFTSLGVSAAASTAASQALGVIFGALFVLSVLALARRRATIPEVRRLSEPADYFDLALLLAVAVTGLYMRLATPEPDLAAVRAYLSGLLAFRPGAIPAEWSFVVHLTLVNVLLIYFPFSKLVHLTGGVVSRALLVRPMRRAAAGSPATPASGGESAAR